MSSLIPIGKKGKWTYVYVDKDGKRRWRSTGTSDEKQARAKQVEWDEEVDLEKDGKVSKTWTFDRFFTEKYRPSYITEHTNSTMINVDIAMRWFKELIEPGELRHITGEHFAQFKAKLQTKVSPETVNCYLAYVGPIFNAAHAWGYISTNPYYNVKGIRTLKRKGRWLEEDARDKLLMTAEKITSESRAIPAEKDAAQDIALAILMAQDTGMRYGEMMYQRIEDVDFEDGFIQVSFHEGGANGTHCKCFRCKKCECKKSTCWHPKGKAERSIPLTPRLESTLFAVRKRIASGAIFSWGWGTISRGIDRCYRRADLAGRGRAHALRHSFKTEMRRAGVDATIMNAILGHGEQSIGDHYDHTNREEIKREFKKLLVYREERSKKMVNGKLKII